VGTYEPERTELSGPPVSRLGTQSGPILELESRKVYATPPPAETREYRDEQMPCKTPLGTDPLKAQPAPVIESLDSDTLRTLELSFKTLFHTGLDAMFLLDGLGCFLHTNAPGCALLGLAPADLLGKSLLEFVPGDQTAQASAMWEAVLIEGQQKAEIQLQTTIGERRDVLLSARSNLWFGVHLLVVRDQTELKALRNAARSFGDPTNAS
jgi:PAS domain S-box-containing protein